MVEKLATLEGENKGGILKVNTYNVDMKIILTYKEGWVLMSSAINNRIIIFKFM